MPTAPPTHRPAPPGRVHQPASEPDQRARERFYRTRRWLDARAAKLRRDPLCQACAYKGRVTPASCVDHAVPISQGGALTDDSQLVSMCKPCHSRKTLLERTGKPAPPIVPSRPRTFVVA
jgi:5-methylcytosine-specific restriction protein A